jgi:hypothetical protein
MTEAESFDVRRGDRALGPPIGRLLIGPSGQIEEVVQAADPYRESLTEIVAWTNQLQVVSVKRAVPGDTRGGIIFQDVSRDDPDLVKAIIEVMKQKYDLLLVPSAPG